MATDSQIFPCPACGIKLSVPLSIAGISGPCPSCWVHIRSPRADDPPSAVDLPVAVAEPEPAEPPHEASDILSSGELEPACAAVPESVDSVASALSRPMARPLPKRLVPEEIVVQPETRIGSMWNALPTPLPRPSRKTLLWLRLLLAALCASGAAALAYFAAR